MADSQSLEDLCHHMVEASSQSGAAYGVLREHREFIEDKKQQAPVKAISQPTVEQFWNAAYEYDPIGDPGSAGQETQLQKLLNYPEWDAIPLGKLLGQAKIALLPGKGALQATEKETITTLRYAATDAEGIAYSDRHPSEFRPHYTKILSLERTRLRRFASLGWVIQIRDDDSWFRTGHVLVIDMEGRGRQPWLVLASHWPADEETSDGSFVLHAQKKVFLCDSTQPGVLPGCRNRTPIGMIDSPNKELPILKQFGPDFNFGVVRFNGDRPYDTETNLGPDLSHVMKWYWDPSANLEVCFDKYGKECMTFDRQTEKIEYLQLKEMGTTAGREVGMFGIILPPPRMDFVPLSERLATIHPHRAQRHRRERETY